MQNSPELFIGLLSGTSIDSIDAVILEIQHNNLRLVTSHSHTIPQELKNSLHNLIANQTTNLQNLGEINRRLGLVFAEAVQAILIKQSLSANKITAIGFHGQTVFHQPDLPYNFSLQLGCANTITEKTSIPVITDFRQRDMINNGQGAPLAPLFHQQFFKHETINRAVVNIGGISNITLLINSPDNSLYIASDLGPGNTLLDLYFRNNHYNKEHDAFDFDYNGSWAAIGEVHQDLLNKLLSDDYFSKPWPKSTGREYFNLAWLNSYLKQAQFGLISAKDIQRTLLELTAKIIADAIIHHNHCYPRYQISEVYICGGGAYNTLLLTRITELLQPLHVTTTEELNMPVEWVEAALFAWLACCTWHKQKCNLKYITGNKNSETMLGCVYY